MSRDNTETLVRMANQIGTFFDSQPGAKAALQIADHIDSFWSPPMRKGLAAHVADTGGTDLRPSVLEAARLIRTSSAENIERALAATDQPSVPHAQGDDAG